MVLFLLKLKLYLISFLFLGKGKDEYIFVVIGCGERMEVQFFMMQRIQKGTDSM